MKKLQPLNIEFQTDNTIKILDSFKPKKITGSRMASILGIGTSFMYNSPFTQWCELTKVYNKPFEDNKFTLAGKEIEPKLADYFKTKYGFDRLESKDKIMSPSEYLGNNKDYAWDFYLNNQIFGGKWDYVFVKDNAQVSNLNPFTDEIIEDAKPTKAPIYKIIECKTAQAKKREQWAKEIPPEYYVQLGLYCWLEKVEKAIFLVAFLEEEDYEKPAGFKPNENNVIAVPVTYDLEQFEKNYLMPAKVFYDTYVATGISPKYNVDNAVDMEYVNAIKQQEEDYKKAQEELENGPFSIKDIDTPFY